MSDEVDRIIAKLTKAQREVIASRRAADGVWYALNGSRAGGAFSRMCDRLAAQGLCDRHGPHPLTETGLAVRSRLLERQP